MAPSLLTAVDCANHVHLVIGSNPLAGARCSKSLDVGATVKLLTPVEETELHYALARRIEDGQVKWLKRDFQDDDLKTLGREEVDGYVDAVFVTLGGKHPLSVHLSNLCRRYRIPINVADAPSLCTFTLLSTHTDGPLQIGTTTSGKGCKFASRIRREIASSLPTGLGAAVDRLGTMRRRIWEEDHAAELAADPDAVANGEDDDVGGQAFTFNKLALDADAARGRRARWLAQICEYWPLQRLAALTDADVAAVLRSYAASTDPSPSALDARRGGPGRIVLAGAGPGHPDLLTGAARKALAAADVVLADKLVPAGVMALIPRRAEVRVARKFPGHADAAQEELLAAGLAALREGKRVLRLKQGDPYLYGRGAEEFTFFARHGFEPKVIPGVTSSLAAPLLAGVPPTHRGVADEVLICTGTGRKGAAPDPPAWVETRTVVFLMALHRLGELVESLVKGNGWPLQVPCAVIERASCPDQRVIRSRLEDVCAAVEQEGSRPPGLLVVGRSCEVLWEGKQRWVVEDGFKGLDGLELGVEEEKMLEQLAETPAIAA